MTTLPMTSMVSNMIGLMACSDRRRARDKTVLSCQQLCSYRQLDTTAIAVDTRLGRDETKLSCRRCEQAIIYLTDSAY